MTEFVRIGRLFAARKELIISVGPYEDDEGLYFINVLWEDGEDSDILFPNKEERDEALEKVVYNLAETPS